MSKELAIEMADEWLSSHRVNETWRVVNMLRDELVQSSLLPLKLVGQINEAFHELEGPKRPEESYTEWAIRQVQTSTIAGVLGAMENIVKESK